MKNFFFNGINSTTVLAPMSIFFAFYAKVLTQSYQTQIEQLKYSDKSNELPKNSAGNPVPPPFMPFFSPDIDEKPSTSRECRK